MDNIWRFREMTKGEMNADPIEGEFFSTEHLESLTDALVRESIQNSLDAGLEGQSVNVKFRFLDLNGISLADKRYFNGLMAHLQADRNGLDSIPESNQSLRVLIVEDFATKGLEGNPEQFNDVRDNGNDSKNDFYFFWRNVGRSSKSQGDRGRWGLGKTVFQATSSINSFIGVSVRSSDRKLLIMGHSVLKPHFVMDKLCYPYGWFGLWDGDFPMPVDELHNVKNIIHDFKLSDRLENSGLSIIILFPDESISVDEIISSTVMHYFYPMLAGNLIVHAGDGDEMIKINNELTDANIMKRHFKSKKFKKETISHLLGFVKWIIEAQNKDFIELSLHNTSKAPSWNASLFDGKQLEQLRVRFELGKKIALQVPMQIQREGEAPETTFFKVFLERDERLESAEDHFIRDGITLVGVSTLKQRGVRVVVIVEDRPLSMLLGDSENPAHTEWQERSPKFKGKYRWGPSCLRFVKNSSREIVKILSRPTKGRDPNLLSNIFSLHDPYQKFKTIKGAEVTGMDDGETPAPEILLKDKNMKIQKVEGGFKISPIDSKVDVPNKFMVSVAYEVRQGNPFSKFNKFDFELNKEPIKRWVRNVNLYKHQPNSLLAIIKNNSFIFKITGFDINRDLRVKVDTWTEENAKEV